jgi:hypothetical protein
MSSKTNIGKPSAVNRESGLRVYMSDASYQEQMRRPVDKFFNNQVRVPHSENKKPYKAPDYGEMEYFAFPPWGFDWEWPQFPDSPVYDGEGTDPGSNPYTGDDEERPDEDFPFLGCDFVSEFVPFEISPGDFATAQLMPKDDAIISSHVSGPCTLVSNPSGCHANMAGPIAAFCTVVLRANDDISGYQENSTGNIPCVVVLGTASGGSCSATAMVQACTPENVIEWDPDNSETVGRSTHLGLSVLKGVGPYTWELTGDGDGFSFPDPVTNGGRNDLATSADCCGAITVTVTDSCGNSCSGTIKCTFGAWAALSTAQDCIFYATDYDTVSGANYYKVIGDQRIMQRGGSLNGFSTNCGTDPCEEECPLQICNCDAYDSNHGCDPCLKIDVLDCPADTPPYERFEVDYNDSFPPAIECCKEEFISPYYYISNLCYGVTATYFYSWECS